MDLEMQMPIALMYLMEEMKPILGDQMRVVKVKVAVAVVVRSDLDS